MRTVEHGEGQRFQLVIDGYNEAIQDNKNGINIFFLPSGGFGTPSSTWELARKVVDYLNTNHANDILYPETLK